MFVLLCKLDYNVKRTKAETQNLTEETPFLGLGFTSRPSSSFTPTTLFFFSLQIPWISIWVGSSSLQKPFLFLFSIWAPLFFHYISLLESRLGLPPRLPKIPFPNWVISLSLKILFPIWDFAQSTACPCPSLSLSVSSEHNISHCILHNIYEFSLFLSL